MMDERLKKLSTTMDPEISKGQVFTDKDKQQILTRIRKLSVPKVRSKRTRTLLPRLLTAALFSGIIFSTYVYFDKEPVQHSQPNVETKQEEPPVVIQNVSGEGSSAKYTLGQKKLTISLRITNKTDRTITDSLKYRITFLNSDLVKATGTDSFTIEPPKNFSFESGDTASISKEYILTEDVAKTSLEQAIKVETISDSGTYPSFVINTIEYVANDIGYPQQEEVEKEEEKEIEKEEKPVPIKISEGEAKEILNRNLSDIRQTLLISEKKNNWHSDNPATYEVAGPDFEPYVTDNFSNNVLKTFLPEYFCECDSGMLPRIHQEVRFNVNAITEDTIELSGIEPASDMIEIGSQWRFKLVKENNVWKLDQWNESTLKQANLNLTKEEAGQLLSTNTNTVTFLKETQVNGTKVYVFTVKDEYGENMFGINARNTSFVYNYE
jgi:hypothetical protein